MTAVAIIEDHRELENVGQKTHEQIDQHIDNTQFVVVSGSVPSSGRTLEAADGITLTDSGPGGSVTIKMPKPTQVGQVMFAVTADQFVPALPIVSDEGWLLNDEYLLIVSTES